MNQSKIFEEGFTDDTKEFDFFEQSFQNPIIFKIPKSTKVVQSRTIQIEQFQVWITDLLRDNTVQKGNYEKQYIGIFCTGVKNGILNKYGLEQNLIAVLKMETSFSSGILFTLQDSDPFEVDEEMEEIQIDIKTYNYVQTADGLNKYGDSMLQINDKTGWENLVFWKGASIENPNTFTTYMLKFKIINNY